MTKKKPSPQNRIWEKERRERLNKTFDDLQRLLPDHEPSSTLSKVEILQRAIELIGKLQKKIKDVVEQCNDPLKEHVKEQEQRLKRLIARNEELAELLRKAKITVPPCKYTIAEEELHRQNEEKENGNRHKKSESKQRRSGTTPKKQPVINKKPPKRAVGAEAIALSDAKTIPTTTHGESATVSSSCPVELQSTPCPPALRHINGIGSANSVNVTPALLPTPIMTTSVLISNNGNLVQVPIVAPPSSLLIVGNEDVRSKINLKNRPLDSSSARYRGKRGKFTIKSIDLIPGRIVNGKIPIPPLRRSTCEVSKSSKMPKLKRKKLLEKCKKPKKATVSASASVKKQSDSDGSLVSMAKRVKTHEHEKQTIEDQWKSSASQEKENETPLNSLPLQSTPVVSTVIGSPCKEHHKSIPPNVNEPSQDTHLDISLNHADLSEDIFANLQVPDDPNSQGNNEDGTLSPTAAYLMNFPLVAGGGKAAGNHVDTGDGEECPVVTPHEQQSPKADSVLVNGQSGNVPESGGMMLDNFASYFNYGHIDTMGSATTVLQQDIPILHPATTTSSSAVTCSLTTLTTSATASAVPPRESGFTNFPAIYQSIDNMLDHRPSTGANRTAGGTAGRCHTSESDFPASVTFTFTLTSTTCTVPTTVQPTMGASHFYGSSCGSLNPVKPVVDDFSSPMKPSIEFTFSLTSTTASEPRTVQSQYTNSTILAPTMTTPSYDTYGYYHKNVSKPNSYCSSFNVLDPLLTAEKPATSFTFSLTSSTKTEPSYAQSSLVTNTTQTYETTPKLSTKHQHHQPMDTGPGRQESTAKVDKVVHRPSAGNAISSGLQQHHAVQSQHQTSSHQNSSQSKYDVSWMAAGVPNGQQSSNVSQSVQQQPQPPYELVPPQIISSLEFPTATGYAGSSNYKSDIFFAHPPGEEHNLTWSSPSKLSNILNDSSSPYFPPVTLPNLNGDLALNTSGNVSCNAVNKANVGSCKIAGNNAKKAYTGTSIAPSGIATVQNETVPGGSFLSVSQLVNEPSKSFPSHSNVASSSTPSTNGACQQKPANNNYSAEALIGNSCNSQSSMAHDNGRKDKLFDYGCTTLESTPGSTGALTFNFDTYGSSSGADYNKGYNFCNQQNGYVSSFGETGYSIPVGGGSNCASANAVGSSGLPYYGKPSSAQGYYNHSGAGSMGSGTGSSAAAGNYHNPALPQSTSGSLTVAQDYTPYYLPSFGEKPPPTKQYHAMAQGGSTEQKTKRSHKPNTIVPAVDYVFPPPVATTTVAGTLSTNSNYGYSVLGNAPGAVGNSGSSTAQMDSLSYPNYHHHHHHHHQQQQQQRLPNQQYAGVPAEPFSMSSTGSRKTSSSSAYHHAQYSTSSVGFSSEKSGKNIQQSHQDVLHHQQPSYPSNHSSSCVNASTSSVSYGTHQSQTSTVYGTASSHHGHSYRQQPSHHINHHQQPPQQQQHQQPLPGTSSSNATVLASNNGTSSNSIPGSSGTITNFNLSTICPEINEKTARSRDGRPAAIVPSVASIMTHW